MGSKQSVLILCTGNSARSQMAEGLLRRRADEHFQVYSAGTEPKGVNPLAVRAMNEIGIDISGHRSKHLSEFLGYVPVHHLLIVCASADGSCPSVWPGVLTRTVKAFDDPAAAQGTEAERLAKFRDVRDQIDQWLTEWLAELQQKQYV